MEGGGRTALFGAGTQVAGVAVVGTGGIARAWHLPEWSKRPDARLLWAVDLDEKKALDVAEAWNVPGWTSDLTKVLEDPAVDVVDLCTPAEVHAEQARVVLGAGKHLLVEKPAGCSLAEVRAMADAADVAGATAMVAENWLFCPGMAHAKRLIDAGELGELVSVAVTLETGVALSRTPDDQRSLLLNSGVHAVNAVRSLMGEPTHVSAFSLGDKGSALTGPGADTALVVSMRFDGGRVGSLQLSGHAQRHPPGAREIRVLGTDGMVEFDVFHGWAEWSGAAWSGGVRRRCHDPDAARGQAEEIDRFVAAVRGETLDYPSLRDQVRTHLVLEAVWRSARELTTVEVAVP